MRRRSVESAWHKISIGGITYYHDLNEEIRYSKSRLSYKIKKLDEAVLARESEETIHKIQGQIVDIEEKLQVCAKELKLQQDSENKDWKEGFAYILLLVLF